MKKKIDVRNIIIVICCITIIAMSIGFAILSIKLDNKTKEKHNTNIEIVKVEPLTSIKGSTYDPIGKYEITDENKSVEFNLKLFAPQDEIAYNIIIKNIGNMKSKIIDILDNEDFNKDYKKSIFPVIIKIKDIKDKELKPQEELSIKLIIKYDETKNINKIIEFPYKMTLITNNK